MTNPAPDPIRLEYQLTFEDFAESVSGQPPRRNALSRIVKVIGPWIFIVVMLGWFASSAPVDVDSVSPAPRLSERLIPALAPAAGLSVLLCWHLIKNGLKPLPRRWTAASGNHVRKIAFRTTRKVLGFLAFVTLGVFFLFLIDQPRGAATVGAASTQPSPSVLSGPDFFLPLSACFVFAIPIMVVATWLAQRNIPRSWAAQIDFQRPVVVEASEAGVMIRDSTARFDCSWEHFAGYLETSNLFVLFSSPLLYRTLPKRAFASLDDIGRFKALVHGHIPEGRFFPSSTGFAVIPLAKAPGLPVEIAQPAAGDAAADTPQH